MGVTYYLTKILYAFVMVPGLTVLLFGIAAFWVRRFRPFFVAAAILSWLLSTQLAGNLLLEPLEKPYNHPLRDAEADGVVVLGAGHYAGSSNLPLTQPGTKRLLYGLMVAKERGLPILFNGLGSEAGTARETATEIDRALGIGLEIAPDSVYRKTFAIYFEDRALNTIWNAKLTKDFFVHNGIEHPVVYLVTSAAHMRRAEYDFRSEGIEVIPAATDFRTNESFCYCYFFPSAEGVALCATAIREYLAGWKDRMHR